MKQVFGVLITAMCLALLVSGRMTLQNTQAAVVKPQPLAPSDGQQHYLASRSVNPLGRQSSKPVAITKTIAMPAQELTSGGTDGTPHILSINNKKTSDSGSVQGNTSTRQTTHSAKVNSAAVNSAKVHTTKTDSTKAHIAKSHSAASTKTKTASNQTSTSAPPAHHVTPNMTVPPKLIPIYKGAAKRYSIPWTVLAAIHDVETHFAVNNFPVSSAGARGPMQFMPAIFKKYGVTAPGQHGKPDILNVPDAVYSTANMLSQDGYSQSPSRALYLYNHSWAYVHHVLYLAGLR